MTEPINHLSEEELQSFADGTLAPEKLSGVRAHISQCDACRLDVARIQSLMKRVNATPAPEAQLDNLWPGIRARIEQNKLVPLGASQAAQTPRHHIGVWLASAAAIAATIVVVLAYRGRPVQTGPADRISAANVSIIAASDSAREYEDQAQALLNDLELRRSMLRPETRQLLDHDLHEVDNAIAELEDAIAHDPKNGVLRQLLASSYRQKVDLLKRVNNAS
jgi:Predicted transmembrane transcriptional regulator (anti-sigma factor)